MSYIIHCGAISNISLAFKLHTDPVPVTDKDRSCGESGETAWTFSPCNKGGSGLLKLRCHCRTECLRVKYLSTANRTKSSPRGGCWLGWPIGKACFQHMATLTLLPPQHQLSERSGQAAGNRQLAGCSKDHVMAVVGRTTSSFSMAARCRYYASKECAYTVLSRISASLE